MTCLSSTVSFIRSLGSVFDIIASPASLVQRVAAGAIEGAVLAVCLCVWRACCWVKLQRDGNETPAEALRCRIGRQCCRTWSSVLRRCACSMVSYRTRNYGSTLFCAGTTFKIASANIFHCRVKQFREGRQAGRQNSKAIQAEPGLLACIAQVSYSNLTLPYSVPFSVAYPLGSAVKGLVCCCNNHPFNWNFESASRLLWKDLIHDHGGGFRYIDATRLLGLCAGHGSHP